MVKAFAVIKDGIIDSIWGAETLEEAQSDNPGATLIEVTIENSPWEIGGIYDERKKNG